MIPQTRFTAIPFLRRIKLSIFTNILILIILLFPQGEEMVHGLLTLIPGHAPAPGYGAHGVSVFPRFSGH